MGYSLINKKTEERLSKPAIVFAYIFFVFLISRFSMYVMFYKATGNHSLHDFIISMNKWDCGWYKWYITNIADNLNILSAQPAPNGQAWWAFFPLYPSLVAALWKIFGHDNVDNLYYIGQSLNTIFFFIAEYFGFKYILLTRRSTFSAYSYITFMSLGLYSFYFSIIYTEALFLMLLTLCFYFMKTKKYIAMGVAGALLSATRNAGIMFVFVVLIDCLQEYITEDLTFDKTHKILSIMKNLRVFVMKYIKCPELILGTCLVPLGFFSYMALLSKITGDGLAFLHVQRSWGKNTNGLYLNMKQAFYYSFPPSYLSIATLIVILIIIITCVRQKRYYETIFSVIILLASASSSFDSVPRYAIGCFTLVAAFSDEFSHFKPINKIVIGLMIMLYEIILIRYWFFNSPLMV